MDFARKQLEKYGWTDGKGLGKKENGISEALKPKLKRSVAGIGHDAAADFTEHWWTQLYDKAAKNVEVEEKHGKIKKIKTKDSEDFEITNSMWKIKKKHKTNESEEQYVDFFVKKAVLTNGGSKMEKAAGSESEEENDNKTNVINMTDEELFAACEGRTAHKGARHGLKATGKLARIAQQEQMLLSRPQYNGYSHAKNHSTDVSVKDLQVVEDMSLNSDADVKNLKKKKKKRCISRSNESTLTESVFPLPKNVKNELQENVASSNNKQRNSKKFKKADGDGNLDVSSKKKKKSNSLDFSSPIYDAQNSTINKELASKNKSKKKKIKCKLLVVNKKYY